MGEELQPQRPPGSRRSSVRLASLAAIGCLFTHLTLINVAPSQARIMDAF
jgi:hypothetical protein